MLKPVPVPRKPLALLSSPKAPMAVAREFVERRCLHDANTLTLRYWCGSWWSWRITHWAETDDRAIRALLYVFTEHADFLDGKGPKPWRPNRGKIADLLEALSAVVIMPAAVETQPCWLDGRETGTIVAVGNGLLDIASRRLHAHTPLYFNQTAVPFDYDHGAREPVQWLAFLGEIWPQEPKAIDVLAEWFGYVISGRLDLHKILLMCGPTRGGKGVIARMETALVGQRNVAGPTLHSLGDQFGLQPLLGKSLAIISDARFVGKNSNVVVERLLSISGEDALTVGRKYRDAYTGKLPTRLHVISNELPKLGDASTAVVGRLVLLLLTRSWLGKEDHALEQRLRGELAAILNWALAGLERLTGDNKNCFTHLQSTDEAMAAMRDLASPVAAFAREKCTVHATKEVGVDELYAAFKTWCEANEYPKSSKQIFGRDLRAAVPSIEVGQKGTPPDLRVRIYKGIALRNGTETQDTDQDTETLL
jgi:putative DNA primase/helicase